MGGANGNIGFDNLFLQIAASNRPERLVARSLVTAFLITVGAPGDRRHPLLQPFMFGYVIYDNFYLLKLFASFLLFDWLRL